MKTFILAGGMGTRLGQLTKSMPKPMVKFIDKPILEYQINYLKRNNFTDINILLSYKGDVISNYFGDGSNWGVSINYYYDDSPLGTAGALKKIESFIHEDFLLLYGDTIMDININYMLEFHKKNQGLATLFVHPNDHPYDSDLCSINNKNKILNFFSKPHIPNKYYKNLVNAAFYIMSPKILEYIDSGIKCDFGKDIFPKLISLKLDIFAYNSPEYIKDVGTPKRLKSVEKDFLSGKINLLNKKNKQSAIFLDRDGVINYDNEIINSPSKFKFYDGVKQAIKKINKSNYLAILATNQPMIAKGFATFNQLDEVHNFMETKLGEVGAFIDRIYFCPHHPEKGFSGEIKRLKIKCNCRKPNTGMIDDAVNEMNIDINSSFFIGDRTVDIKAGSDAGLTTVLLKQGFSGNDNKYKISPDFIFDNLNQAVDFILEKEN